MEQENIIRLLKRYVAGKSSIEEKEQVDYWYHSFEDEPVKKISDEEWMAIGNQIWVNVESSIGDRDKGLLRRIPVWLKVAAIAIPVIVASGLFFFSGKNKIKDTPVVVTYTNYQTGTGERKTVQIKDGSVLELNAATTIRICDDFSKERRVELMDGEVFFDVQRDTTRPFIIESGNLTTRVLGTAFNISAYKDLNKMSVGVVRGKVSVSEKDNPLSLLQKDEELVYDRAKTSYNVRPLENGLLEWKEGRLVLNDVSFETMSVLMEKNFGVKISTKQSRIKNSRYTTELQTSMKPMEAVEVLAAIHHLKISGRSNHILLYE